MARSRGLRRSLSVLGVMIVLVGCANSPPSASPTPVVSPASTQLPTPATTPTATPAASPSPAAEIAMSEVQRTSAPPAAAKKAAAGLNAFGLDLYRRILADKSLDLAGKNVVFSPTSIALALAMARAGARGETAAEMDAVLHASGWDALGSGLNALDQALASRDATWQDGEGTAHQLALRIANAAFAQRGWSIEQAYLDAVASTFGAGLRLVDYKVDPEAARKTINAWVKEQTAGRIPELLPKPPNSPIDTLTRLVLVNAIYLKANWAREFSKDATKPAPFTRLDGSRVTVPTMSLFGGQDVPYASATDWKATELRYLGADGSTPLAMTLILPDDVATFEATLTSAKLGGIISNLDKQRQVLARVTSSGGDGDCGSYAYSLDLLMPRFGIETGANLVEALKALGMPLAFDVRTADFGGITTSEKLYIAAVIHKANIDVDEKGTEAAAATVVAMGTGGCTGPGPARTLTLRLNRPFLFVLRDVQTGAVLFMGRVVDPSVK